MAPRRKPEIAIEIAKTQAGQKTAQEAYERVAAPILKNLQATAEYRKASEEAKAAHARLKSLREDKSLGEDERSKQAQEAASVAMRPSELEKAALEADPKAKAARDNLAKAEENARKVHPGIEILRLSNTTGDGLKDWLGWLERRKKLNVARTGSLA